MVADDYRRRPVRPANRPAPEPRSESVAWARCWTLSQVLASLLCALYAVVALTTSDPGRAVQAYVLASLLGLAALVVSSYADDARHRAGGLS